MNRAFATLLASAAALCAAPAAYAASSDYLLELDGVKGEASSSIEISSWSWGASNGVVAPRDVSSGQSSGKRSSIAIDEPGVRAAVAAPRDAASGQATGKRTHKPVRMTGSAAAVPGGVTVATGDLDGDGLVDLADTAALPEVEQFTLTFDKATPKLMESCAKGTHFPKATIKMRTASFTLENATVVSCTTGQPAIVDNKINGNNQMPNRISMNVTTPKQTQGATFGEKVNQGLHAAGSMVVQLSGQLKHTKTGHVTILK